MFHALFPMQIMNKTYAPKILISPNKVWVMVLLINACAAFENIGAIHDPELPLLTEKNWKEKQGTHIQNS